MILFAVAVLPLLGLFVWWTARDPFRAFVLYAAVLPLGSSIALPVGLPPPFDTLSTLLGAVTGMLLAWRLLADPSARRHVSGATWIWVMFLAANAITYLWSINRSETLNQVTVLAPLVALFAVASMYRVSGRELSWLEAGIVAGGAVAGAVALAMAATGTLYPSGTGVPRFYASGGDPNITAASLQLPFAVALSWAIEGRGRERTIGFVAAMLTAAGVVFTVSRGGMLSLLVVLGAWMIFTRRPRLLAVTAVVALIAFAFIPDAVTQRLTQTGSTGRVEIWEVGVAACTDHCLIGAGMGVFPELHERTILSDPTMDGNELRLESHNIFLGAAVELGVVGLVLLVAGLWVTWAEGRRGPGRHGRAAVSALAGVVMSNLLVSNVEFKYFWLVLTYAVVVGGLDHGRGGFSPGPHQPRSIRLEPV